MSSPVPDDYASLVYPWNPLTESASKNVGSARDMVENHRDTKVGDAAATDSVGAHKCLHGDTQHEDLGYSDTESIDANIVAGDGVQENLDNTDIDSSTGNGALMDSVQIIDTDDDAPQHIDTRCVAVSTCVANSGDHRKVVSHIFGRNKACTRNLPYNLWILWCRKHYQRFKYRAEDSENWHFIQLGLVRAQLQTFENWGKVRTWTINLRKAEKDALAKESRNESSNTDRVSPCWERFLVPYTGPNRTFAQVRAVLNLIERKFYEAEYRNRDKKLKSFPGVEFLPMVFKAKEARKPAAAKRGEVRYKKITLDQPSFKRKTRANKQFLRDEAARKDGDSSMATGSVAGSPPNSVTYASDASIPTKRTKIEPNNTTTPPLKRKSIDSTNKTPPTSTPSTKRRRLTRGYDRHAEPTTPQQEERVS